MFNLIRNENMKIYRRLSTWVMVALLLAAILGMGLIIKTLTKEESPPAWQSSLIAENDSLKNMLSQDNLPPKVREQYEQRVAVNEYRLKHNLPPVQPNSVWGFMNLSAGLVSLITLFTIIVGAGMVSSEFTWGTIKLLLIRPVSRTKILFSKYLSMFLFTFFLLMLLFLFSFVVGILLFGGEGINTPDLTYWNGQVVEISYALHILILYGFGMVDLIMMATFAFMISSVFRNHSLAIGLSLFLMFTGKTAVGILSSFGHNEWVKYLLFANTDLSVYFGGVPPIEGMTLPFSIAVLIVYYLLFLFLSWIFFKKRDVAA